MICFSYNSIYKPILIPTERGTSLGLVSSFIPQASKLIVCPMAVSVPNHHLFLTCSSSFSSPKPNPYPYPYPLLSGFSRPWLLRPFTSSKPPPRTLAIVQAKKQTFSSLDELLEKAEKPVLVDFYATWCGPCQFMGPILNEVSISMGDDIQVVKIDTEKYPQIANKYNIEALPTFILFKDGKPCDRFEGALTANQLIQRIEGTLKLNK
ncbi:hypothetical protein QVD17_07704 [Tagetes erecta]|uniref:Thioredoxin domain-containing protein n=1 Tax=Tagetes erecta TaxID=13708 RepID=A0AAD8PD01_TARER|nr:hypothetical protein QVD17_07704 [Tagetes erecta]